MQPVDSPKAEPATRQTTSETSPETSDLFMGIQPVSPEQLYGLIPELKDKPALLTFHSQFCLDCKAMKPIIEASAAKYPTVIHKTFEIQEDLERYKAILQAFKPVTVPVFVFIDKHGKIVNVLYNQQPQTLVEQNLDAISRS